MSFEAEFVITDSLPRTFSLHTLPQSSSLKPAPFFLCLIAQTSPLIPFPPHARLSSLARKVRLASR